MKPMTIAVLLLLLLAGGEKKPFSISSGKQQSSITHSPVKKGNYCKDSHPLDTTQLKQTNWYAQAVNYISESEYNISNTGSYGFAAPNRGQGLLAMFRP